MPGFSDQYETAVLGFALMGANHTYEKITEGTRHLCLLTSIPSEGARGGPGASLPGELNLDQYQRQELTAPNSWRLEGANNRYVLNVTVVFTGLPACTIAGWALAETVLTSHTGHGNAAITFGAFAAPVSVPAGGTLVIPAGALVVTLD